MNKKYRKIYRFEQDDNNGCWYNHDQTFNNKYGKEVKVAYVKLKECKNKL